MRQSGNLEKAKERFNNLSSKEVKPNVRTYTILIGELFKGGLSTEAESLFAEMEVENVVPNDHTFNVMVQGFLNGEDFGKAVEFLKLMEDREFFPNAQVAEIMVNLIAFPKLKKLAIGSFAELEDWEIPTSKDRKMMPLLSQLTLGNCPELRELPRVLRMEALEELELWSLNSVKGVGVEFVGDNEGSLQDGVTFPKLKELGISFI